MRWFHRGYNESTMDVSRRHIMFTWQGWFKSSGGCCCCCYFHSAVWGTQRGRLPSAGRPLPTATHCKPRLSPAWNSWNAALCRPGVDASRPARAASLLADCLLWYFPETSPENIPPLSARTEDPTRPRPSTLLASLQACEVDRTACRAVCHTAAGFPIIFAAARSRSAAGRPPEADANRYSAPREKQAFLIQSQFHSEATRDCFESTS